MQPDLQDRPSALLITGTVGVGKTSVAAAAGSLLARAGCPHAVIDLDALSSSWPTPPDDPFNLTMELQNLQSVAHNYMSAGARRLVLSGVVETTAERERYRSAVAIDLRVCRLRAELAELHRRLRIRHAGEDGDLRWHLNRAGQLDQILDNANVEDFQVRSGDRMIVDVAADVLSGADWV